MKISVLRKCRLSFAGILFMLALVTMSSVSPATAQDRQPTGITVTGHGETTAAPDIAYVSLGVFTRDKTAAQAASENARIAQAIKNAVKAQGVAEKDIQTENYSVQPWMEYPREGGTPRQLGYEVSNTVRVTVRDIRKVGSIIDAGVKAGANNVQGVAFGIDNNTQLMQQALTEAVGDARSRAETIARALGVKLGAPVSVTSAGYVPPPRPMYRADVAMAGAATTPISPGELTVTQDVTITFAMIGP